MSSEEKFRWLPIVLQLVTIVSVGISAIFTYYSQKSLIKYKVEVERKEASLFGTSSHEFIPKEYFKDKYISLVNYQTSDGSKKNVIAINDFILSRPVNVNLLLKNEGNSSAKGVEIHISSPYKGLLRGTFIPDEKFPDCRYTVAKELIKADITCPQFKQGQQRIFKFKWFPEVTSDELNNLKMVKLFSTEVDPMDIISVEAYADNAPKALILSGNYYVELAITKGQN